jgi:hypothetical protein
MCWTVYLLAISSAAACCPLCRSHYTKGYQSVTTLQYIQNHQCKNLSKTSVAFTLFWICVILIIGTCHLCSMHAREHAHVSMCARACTHLQRIVWSLTVSWMCGEIACINVLALNLVSDVCSIKNIWCFFTFNAVFILTKCIYN